MMKAIVLGCVISGATLGVAMAQDAAPAPDASTKVVVHKHEGATKKVIIKKHHPAKKVVIKHEAE